MIACKHHWKCIQRVWHQLDRVEDEGEDKEETEKNFKNIGEGMKSRTGEEQKAKEGPQQWGGWWEEKVKVEEEDGEANWPDITDLLSLLCSFTALTNAVETIFSALSCTLSDQNKSDLQIHERRADQSPRLSPLKLLLWRTNYKPKVFSRLTDADVCVRKPSAHLLWFRPRWAAWRGWCPWRCRGTEPPCRSRSWWEPLACRTTRDFLQRHCTICQKKFKPNDTKNMPAHPPTGNPTASCDVHLQKKL